MFNMDPASMQRLMKQLGIKSEEIEAKKVIIELENKKLEIKEPKVVKMLIQGMETYQIVGNAEEMEAEPNEEDVSFVMEQASVSREKAIEALKKNNNDIAAALMYLKKEGD